MAVPDSDSETENPGIEVMALPSAKASAKSSAQKAAANVLKQLDSGDDSEQSAKESGGPETTFGSETLHKTQPNPIVYESGSETTFGSEVIQKMRPVYESGSETTFGSELLTCLLYTSPSPRDA